MCDCFFSVIIPTYNRPHLVTACVESVLAQDFPPERYEIFVVDDGGRGRTARALAPHLEQDRVRYLRQRRGGWGAARLLGARHSRGQILAFIDDDCIAPPDWLTRYAAIYVQRPNVDGVGGGLRPGPQTNVAGRKQYLGHIARFNRLNAPLDIRADQAGQAWFTFGGNRTFRRDVWLSAQAAGTVSWYYDDYLIDLHLREMEANVYYEPRAWVRHHYVLSLGQRLRAAYRYGRSEAAVLSKSSAADVLRVDQRKADRSHSVAVRWRRLRAEAPHASALDRAWYAATQPLVWLARRLGRCFCNTPTSLSNLESLPSSIR